MSYNYKYLYYDYKIQITCNQLLPCTIYSRSRQVSLANFVCDENNSRLSFRQLFFLRIDAFLADFCSFEIGYRWSSTVSLHVFECIIERAIASEYVL